MANKAVFNRLSAPKTTPPARATPRVQPRNRNYERPWQTSRTPEPPKSATPPPPEPVISTGANICIVADEGPQVPEISVARGEEVSMTAKSKEAVGDAVMKHCGPLRTSSAGAVAVGSSVAHTSPVVPVTLASKLSSLASAAVVNKPSPSSVSVDSKPLSSTAVAGKPMLSSIQANNKVLPSSVVANKTVDKPTVSATTNTSQHDTGAKHDEGKPLEKEEDKVADAKAPDKKEEVKRPKVNVLARTASGAFVFRGKVSPQRPHLKPPSPKPPATKPTSPTTTPLQTPVSAQSQGSGTIAQNMNTQAGVESTSTKSHTTSQSQMNTQSGTGGIGAKSPASISSQTSTQSTASSIIAATISATVSATISTIGNNNMSSIASSTIAATTPIIGISNISTPSTAAISTSQISINSAATSVRNQAAASSDGESISSVQTTKTSLLPSPKGPHTSNTPIRSASFGPTQTKSSPTSTKSSPFGARVAPATPVSTPKINPFGASLSKKPTPSPATSTSSLTSPFGTSTLARSSMETVVSTGAPTESASVLTSSTPAPTMSSPISVASTHALVSQGGSTPAPIPVSSPIPKPSPIPVAPKSSPIPYSSKPSTTVTSPIGHVSALRNATANTNTTDSDGRSQLATSKNSSPRSIGNPPRQTPPMRIPSSGSPLPVTPSSVRVMGMTSGKPPMPPSAKSPYNSPCHSAAKSRQSTLSGLHDSTCSESLTRLDSATAYPESFATTSQHYDASVDTDWDSDITWTKDGDSDGDDTSMKDESDEEKRRFRRKSTPCRRETPEYRLKLSMTRSSSSEFDDDLDSLEEEALAFEKLWTSSPYTSNRDQRLLKGGTYSPGLTWIPERPRTGYRPYTGVSRRELLNSAYRRSRSRLATERASSAEKSVRSRDFVSSAGSRRSREQRDRPNSKRSNASRDTTKLNPSANQSRARAVFSRATSLFTKGTSSLTWGQGAASSQQPSQAPPPPRARTPIHMRLHQRRVSTATARKRRNMIFASRAHIPIPITISRPPICHEEFTVHETMQPPCTTYTGREEEHFVDSYPFQCQNSIVEHLFQALTVKSHLQLDKNTAYCKHILSVLASLSPDPLPIKASIAWDVFLSALLLIHAVIAIVNVTIDPTYRSTYIAFLVVTCLLLGAYISTALLCSKRLFVSDKLFSRTKLQQCVQNIASLFVLLTEAGFVSLCAHAPHQFEFLLSILCFDLLASVFLIIIQTIALIRMVKYCINIMNQPWRCTAISVSSSIIGYFIPCCLTIISLLFIEIYTWQRVTLFISALLLLALTAFLHIQTQSASILSAIFNLCKILSCDPASQSKLSICNLDPSTWPFIHHYVADAETKKTEIENLNLFKKLTFPIRQLHVFLLSLLWLLIFILLTTAFFTMENTTSNIIGGITIALTVLLNYHVFLLSSFATVLSALIVMLSLVYPFAIYFGLSKKPEKAKDEL